MYDTVSILLLVLELICDPVADIELITFGCSSSEEVIDYSACSFDGGPFEQCECQFCLISGLKLEKCSLRLLTEKKIFSIIL